MVKNSFSYWLFLKVKKHHIYKVSVLHLYMDYLSNCGFFFKSTTITEKWHAHTLHGQSYSMWTPEHYTYMWLLNMSVQIHEHYLDAITANALLVSGFPQRCGTWLQRFATPFSQEGITEVGHWCGAIKSGSTFPFIPKVLDGGWGHGSVHISQVLPHRTYRNCMYLTLSTGAFLSGSTKRTLSKLPKDMEAHYCPKCHCMAQH